MSNAQVNALISHDVLRGMTPHSAEVGPCRLQCYVTVITSHPEWCVSVTRLGVLLITAAGLV